MKLYSENDNYKLYSGSMLDMLEVIEKESVDVVLTDPPYELNFMNKGWDNAGISFQPDTWKRCYEVLKPGGYLLAFGGSRTFHRIACAIEDAGFEIRDTIMWLYGSGFPKSMNIGFAIDKKNGVDNRTGIIKIDRKATNSGSGCYNCNNSKDNSMKQEYEERIAQNEWSGWGTCLKPSFEPIIVARKPFKGSLVDNVIEYGVGGINIDECRVGNETISIHNAPKGTFAGGEYGRGSDTESYRDSVGRFPANTILTYDETDYDEVCSGFPDTKSQIGARGGQGFHNCLGRPDRERKDGNKLSGFNDSGSASRYFYCAKASKKDRDEGCQDLEDTVNACSNQAIAELKRGNDNFSDEINSTFNKVYKGKNTHPTVKPTELMQYLVRLVSPEGATILDPFNGSGSTGKAVMYENKERNKNYKYIGIELTEEYLPISKARIEYVCNLEPEKDNQTSIFDFIEE